MNEKVYQPISCASHSELELYIMQRKSLRITWQDGEGKRHQLSVVPKDILTRTGEEFLLCETLQQERIEIRLDYIQNIQPEDPVTV